MGGHFPSEAATRLILDHESRAIEYGEWFERRGPKDSPSYAEHEAAERAAFRVLGYKQADLLRYVKGLEDRDHVVGLECAGQFAPTRRDYFAAAALTGTLGSHYESTLPEAAARYAEIAVRLADATIAELDK